MSATVKAAWIGAAAVVIAAIVGGLFSLRSGVSTVDVSGNVGDTAVVIGGEQVVINQGSPTPPAAAEPMVARFDLADPRLELVRFYDLNPEDKQVLGLGSCPEPPCFLVSMHGAKFGPKPTVDLAVGGQWAGISVPEGAFHFTLPLAQACGFTFQTGDFDLLFEVIDDRATNLRAVLGALRGSGPSSGVFLKEAGCQPDA